MSSTRFVCNDSLWHEIQNRAKSAKQVRAAVAFIGVGGADLLPLKKGDSLVVNLGWQTVKQGLTAPREIQRLIRRGVHVFTRSTLHAKFFIFDRALIVGSTNVSRNSQNVLDEAGALTTDLQAIRRARGFFDKLCSEPVRPEYLKKCLASYTPPRFEGDGSQIPAKRQKRVIEAKLWFISGLQYIDTPAADAERIATIEEEAQQCLSDPDRTEVNWIHYARKPKFLDYLRFGDWIIECVRDSDKIAHVHAPAQVLGVKRYTRSIGRSAYLLTSEASRNSESILFSKFRRRVRRLAPFFDQERPRTRPIEDIELADRMLRLWTPSGRISRRRKGP